MKTRLLPCMLLVAALAAAGCAYNRSDVVSSAKPDWLHQKPADTAEKSFYIGQEVGDGIVNTDQARERAMDDVCRQIADSLRPAVVEQALAIADQDGVPHKGLDAECAACGEQVRKQVDQVATSLQQEGFYWERWASRDGMFHSPTYHYRYYILASMSKELRDKLTTELVHLVANDIQARAKQASGETPAKAG